LDRSVNIEENGWWEDNVGIKRKTKLWFWGSVVLIAMCPTCYLSGHGYESWISYTRRISWPL
jgi:hypothetical protein